MGMNENALAEDSFRTALSMRANDPDVLNNYGWFLCLTNRFADGKATLPARGAGAVRQRPVNAA